MSDHKKSQQLIRLLAVDAPPTRKYLKRHPSTNPSGPINIKTIQLAKHACPFSKLRYWRPRKGCFPDAMHTIGGVVKDLFRMLMGRHFKRGRMSDALVKYMVERNKVPLATQKLWEAGEYCLQSCDQV